MLDRFRGRIAPIIRKHPTIKSFVARTEDGLEMLRHSAAHYMPQIIRPRTYKIMIAVTADCNSRCVGCRYGRDFMPGHQLSLEMARQVLEDAREAGFYSIRLYGGEPTLHPDLPKMVEAAVDLRLRPYVTTNASTLHRKIDDLYSAGLRDLSVGFYGVGKEYDEYTQRPGLFDKVERGIATVRERYGDEIDMQLNWLLMRPRANLDSLHRAWEFANKYQMPMRVDLVHYSLPYFQEGPERAIQFRPEDRPVIEEITRELIRLKEENPKMIHHDLRGLRSIPDWLIKGPDMKVPCTAYEMIWVGADGSVQMCYVTFPLGNLHERRLRDMLFSKEHRCAARDGFELNCPNCHCSSNERIMRHAPSRRLYSTKQLESAQ